jgi:hypothetical protein
LITTCNDEKEMPGSAEKRQLLTLENNGAAESRRQQRAEGSREQKVAESRR